MKITFTQYSMLRRILDGDSIHWIDLDLNNTRSDTDFDRFSFPWKKHKETPSRNTVIALIKRDWIRCPDASYGRRGVCDITIDGLAAYEFYSSQLLHKRK